MTRRRHARAGAPVALALAVVCGTHAEGLRAQTDPTDPAPRANYAFATQLGSGVYTSHETSVHVYRLGLGIRLRSPEDHRVGLQLRVPLTLGFYDFAFPEVLYKNGSEGVRTLALVPELRFDIAVGERWRLMPFGSLGAGRDFSAGRTSYIAATGLRSRLSLGWGRISFLLGNRLLYSAFTTSGLDAGDDFAGLESGIDARHPLGLSVAGHRVDAGLFFADYLYFVSPDLVPFIGEARSIEQQWELGVTFGTVTPWGVLGVTMPRVGVAYRFGSGASIVRIILGGPFN